MSGASAKHREPGATSAPMLVTLTTEQMRELVREELRAALADAPGPFKLVREELRAALSEIHDPVAFLSVEQAAKAAQRSERTILDWIRAGQLRAKKRARRWVIHRAELERFLTCDEDEITPPPPAASESELARSVARILKLAPGQKA